MFYKPLGYIKFVAKTGIVSYYTAQLAMRKMMKQSRLLKEHKQDASLPVYSVYFLTGHKYWYQTAFCLYSLQKVCSNIRIQALIIDDGSFTSDLKKQVMRQFPSAQIIFKRANRSFIRSVFTKVKISGYS
ncbi:MAG: hypothetical protein JKY70_01265 [Mucilaginibacter sp.]|nr:hypothetical protein [Mucilaginibacter sp.]